MNENVEFSLGPIVNVLIIRKSVNRKKHYIFIYIFQNIYLRPTIRLLHLRSDMSLRVNHGKEVTKLNMRLSYDMESTVDLFTKLEMRLAYL